MALVAERREERSGPERMSPAEWRRLGGFYAVVALLHVVGWGTFLLVVLPAHYPALGIGTATLAYTFGLRHAFDADHISAIDTTARKLMADGQRPMGVGFFFSLGHSTVVFGLAVGLAVAARRIAGAVTSDGSALHSTGGLIGTIVSGTFLYLIGILNLAVLLGIIRVFREMREGRYDDDALERRLNDRGLLFRFFGPLARSIRSSWQLYPLGVLIVGMFVVTWAVALAVWRLGDVERRWSGSLASGRLPRGIELEACGEELVGAHHRHHPARGEEHPRLRAELGDDLAAGAAGRHRVGGGVDGDLD